MMIPGATEEQMRWLDELQRVAASAETASDALRQRRRPTASTCCPASTYRPWCCTRSRDQMNDFEHGRLLAKGIPGARLVPLDSDNHILLGDEPAWPVFVDEVRGVRGPDGAPGPCTDGLSRASARCWPWSPTAVERRDRGRAGPQRPHGRAAPAERYTKLGVRGPSARAAAAAALART